MRRHVRWILGSTLMALALTAPGLPQGPPQGFPQGSSLARPSAVPVTIQIVLTKGEGDKKVSSPYSLTSSSGEVTSFRLGTEVPIPTTGAGGQTQFTFQQIGTQIDFRITPVESSASPLPAQQAGVQTGTGARSAVEGRYKVQITITKREIYDSVPTIPQSDPSRPIFYNFIFAGTLVLGNGETAQITGTDLVTNETWQADVTLSLKR
jgi:Flp pilus assembly secretin CpaC